MKFTRSYQRSKKKDESFSELFERLVEDKNHIETLTKLRVGVEFREKEKMLSEIYKQRVEGCTCAEQTQ